VEINSFFGSFFNDGLLSIVSVALDRRYQDRQQIGFQNNLFDTFLVVD
jgi:hypothetical protein